MTANDLLAAAILVIFLAMLPSWAPVWRRSLSYFKG